MRADLHIHSRYSDGGYWPSEIARLAKASGLEASCVSDHETLGAYPEFAEAARAEGLATWPAVEIDCVEPSLGYKSEILAYFPERSYRATGDFLADILADRRKRIVALFEKSSALFGKAGIDFRTIVAKRLSGRPAGLPPVDEATLRFSKTDVFLALRDAGVVSPRADYRDFKKAYFDTGIFSGLKFAKPTLAKVARVAAQDGGILVVPHIGHEFGDSASSMREDSARLDAMLARFKDLGVGGIELYDYRNADTGAINGMVADRCSRYGFFNTFGSDCHGPDSNKNGLGAFYGKFEGFPPSGKPGRDRTWLTA